MAYIKIGSLDKLLKLCEVVKEYKVNFDKDILLRGYISDIFPIYCEYVPDKNILYYNTIPNTKEIPLVSLFSMIISSNYEHIWTAADGTTYYPRDMSSAHIINCLNILENDIRYISMSNFFSWFTYPSINPKITDSDWRDSFYEFLHDKRAIWIIDIFREILKERNKE